MQLLYNSDSYAVVHIELAPEAPTLGGGRGGYEIVDKLAGKEIFIDGLLAEQFKSGVQAIADADASPEAFDAFIGRYTALAQQPLVVH